MSTKLLLLFLVLCATQLQTSVNGQKSRLASQSKTGLETNVGKPYNGIRGSENRMDEIPEYEQEKGVFIRNKRAAATKKPVDPETMKKIQKRVSGFVKVFGALTITLVVLSLVNIGLFVWLSMTLSTLRKP